MRTRIAVVLALVLGAVIVLPVAGWPGSGPRPVPTRVQTLDLESIAMAGGRGMSGVDQPTASQSSVIETDRFRAGRPFLGPPPADGSVVKVRVREESGWTSWMQVPFDDDHGLTQPRRKGNGHAWAAIRCSPAVGRGSGQGADPGRTGPTEHRGPPRGHRQRGHPAAAAVRGCRRPGMPPIITRAQWVPTRANATGVRSTPTRSKWASCTTPSPAAPTRNPKPRLRCAIFTPGTPKASNTPTWPATFGRPVRSAVRGSWRRDEPASGRRTHRGAEQRQLRGIGHGNFDEFNPPTLRCRPSKNRSPS